MKKLLAILVSALMVVMTALPVMATTPFADVPDYHWAVDAVNLLAALGVVEGYPDGTFKGGQPATRYEVALMIARALEDPGQGHSEPCREHRRARRQDWRRAAAA